MLLLKSFCYYYAPFLDRIFRGMSWLIAHVADETLLLLSDTLIAVLKINRDLPADYDQILGPMLIDLWTKSSSDFMMCDLVVDITKVLVKNSQLMRPLEVRLLPVILNIFQERHEQENLMATAMDLSALMIKSSSAPLLSIYFDQLYPQVLSLLLETEDPAILQVSFGLIAFRMGNLF